MSHATLTEYLRQLADNAANAADSEDPHIQWVILHNISETLPSHLAAAAALSAPG